MSEMDVALALSLVSMGIAIAAYVRERRSHGTLRARLKQVRLDLAEEQFAVRSWTRRAIAAETKLARLTDRDERGRFVKREGAL